MCRVTEETLSSLIESARTAERAGKWGEALTRYEAAFSRLPAEGDAADAADLLRGIGNVYRERGELDVAYEHYEASCAVAEANGLEPQLASALNCLAVGAQFRGWLDLTDRYYARARRLAEKVGDSRLAAGIDQNRGTVANIRGDLQIALRRYRAALTKLRSLGDEHATMCVLNNLGMAQVDLGNWEDAEECFSEAFQLADHLRDTGMIGTVELNRAELFTKSERFERARDCCDRAFEIFTRLESKSGCAEACKTYGVLYRETRKPGLAEAHLQHAMELAEGCGDRLLVAESLSELARLYLSNEKSRESLRCLNRAQAIFEELEARREVVDIDRRLDALEDTYLDVVTAWAQSIEAKDRYTAGHCQRVADYACTLATRVGIDGRDLTWLRMGAILHDVGKITVPADVLNKPGKLTPREWELMQRHTVEGDRIISELNFPWDIRPLVRSHHEHWAGTGYPDGLAGKDIPLTARVLCVVDVYDALTTARAYRPALSQDEALRIMDRDSGRIFDPELYAIFRSLITDDACPDPVGTGGTATVTSDDWAGAWRVADADDAVLRDGDEMSA